MVRKTIGFLLLLCLTVFSSNILAEAKTEDEMSVDTAYQIATTNILEDKYSDADIIALAMLIDAEAGSDSLENRVGIAQVVKNRLNSELFPNTVIGVITQKNQFADYTNGSPKEENIVIAKTILTSQTDIFSKNILFFRNPDRCKDGNRGEDWNGRTYVLTLGKHDFYRYIIEEEV